jgi:Carbohydrate family 9 binding domain-like
LFREIFSRIFLCYLSGVDIRIPVAILLAPFCFTLTNAQLKTYQSPFTAHRVTMDGALSDTAWVSAPWSEPFVDIEGGSKPDPRFRTRVKMIWDDSCIYIGAELQEPNVWATLRTRDTVIFLDNDFEVFIDPDGDRREYCELEMNALNTVWDLFMDRPYRQGGKADNAWDIKGLRTAVRISGTLNTPADIDSGWTAEIAIPWSALAPHAHSPLPPADGDQWRMNFSRVEWTVAGGTCRKVAGKREDNWVWSPQGVIDMHRPERWGIVSFVRPPASH